MVVYGAKRQTLIIFSHQETGFPLQNNIIRMQGCAGMCRDVEHDHEAFPDRRFNFL